MAVSSSSTCLRATGSRPCVIFSIKSALRQEGHCLIEPRNLSYPSPQSSLDRGLQKIQKPVRRMLTKVGDQLLDQSSVQSQAAQPSASVLLISATNQILLLHRIAKASSFASAHVFPGGALSDEHDGQIPEEDHTDRHRDGAAYRMAAIRETFEESGILLVKNPKRANPFAGISDDERDQGRRAVHAGTIKFSDLMKKWGVEPDVDALMPFTRWITPTGISKRFSTQMYMYFLPLGSLSRASDSASSVPSHLTLGREDDINIPGPTHDGGIEHIAARFLSPNQWLDLARENRITLFPPQFFLMHLLLPFLGSTVTRPCSPTPSIQDLQLERERLLKFLLEPRMFHNRPEVSFAEACISPMALGRSKHDDEVQQDVGRPGKSAVVLALDYPGKEVEEQNRKGIMEWVVVTSFTRDGPRNMEVKKREEVLGKGTLVSGKL